MNKKGFTILELMISIFIFGMVSTIAVNFITTSSKSIRFSDEQGTAVENARNAVNQMVSELKEAKHSEGTDSAIKKMEDQDLIYYADYDNDGKTEQIRYTIDDKDLIKIITEPGTLNDYTGAVSTSTLSKYINNENEPIFYYFDANMATATEAYDVRLIRAYLKVNVTPTIMPNDYIIITDVSLRNLKDNL